MSDIDKNLADYDFPDLGKPADSGKAPQAPPDQAPSDSAGLDDFDISTEPIDEPDKTSPPTAPAPDIDKLIQERLEKAKAELSTNALAESLKEIASSLKPKPAPAEPPKPITARLTPEEKKKINEELYSTDNPAELIDQIIAAKVDSVAGFVAAETSKRLVEQEAELLKLSSPEFREFEPEIRELVNSLPAQNQLTPGVYRWALEQVKAKNIDKIIEKRLQEKLQELGKNPTKPGQSRPIPPKQAPSQPSPGQEPASKRRVYVPPEEIERAKALGIGPGSAFWEDTKARLIEKYSKLKK